VKKTLSQYEQLLTTVFTANDQVEILEVAIRIKGRKNLPKSSSCQSLLTRMTGIVASRPASSDDSHLHASNVVIKDVSKDFYAYKAFKEARLRVNDVIRAVDGHQVNLATIEQLLSTFNQSCKVKLTLQRNNEETNESNSEISLEENDQLKHPLTVTSLLSTTDPAGETIKKALKNLPFIFLLITK